MVRKFHIIFIQLILSASTFFAQDYSPITKAGKKYALSAKMSINMKDSDIRNILMMIGELTNLNIVISPDVQDTITANLENVSVKAALDAILIPNGYSYFVQENILIIKTSATEMVGELVTVVKKLNYINADELSSPLGAVMSSRGKLQSFTPLVTPGAGGAVSNIIVINFIFNALYLYNSSCNFNK